MMKLNNTLIFVRHGENVINNEICNDELPLSCKGILEAKKLLKNHLNFKFDKVYSSTSLRALMTAKIICNNENTIIQDERLIERGWGNKRNGKENDDEARLRILKFLKEINENNQNKIILIVTHGALMRLIQDVIEENIKQRNRIYNCSVIQYDKMGKKKITHLDKN